jgi:hypothetical protein
MNSPTGHQPISGKSLAALAAITKNSVSTDKAEPRCVFT